MKPKNTLGVFLTLIFLFLVCTSSAFAGNQEHQKGIIDRINHQQQQQTAIIDELQNTWNELRFYGEVLLSEVSYKINHLINTDADEDTVTPQADLDFWNNLTAQYPFSEKPVFISLDNVSGPAYDYIPEGISKVTFMDNSGNALDSYTVTKNETGFTIQKGVPGNLDQNYTITLNELKKLDGIYGNTEQVKVGEAYIKEQIRTQE
jgi:hypothetical protein